MITVDAAPGSSVPRRGRDRAISLLVARRLAFGIPLLLIVSLGMFVLAKASPFDPVQRYFGARIIGASAERVAQIRENWGVDAPVLTQYGAWLAHAVTGDFGDSHSLQQPVSQVIGERLGWSVLLLVVAFAGALLLGVVLGTAAA
jgi:peptide/nickel transport system permease protein